MKIAQYGGEEFTLILTAISHENSLSFLDDLLRKIEKELSVTVSAGIASSSMSDDIDQLLKLADNALFQSKQNGRNRISVAKAA